MDSETIPNTINCFHWKPHSYNIPPSKISRWIWQLSIMHLANLSVIFIALVVAATALKIPRYFRGDFEKDIANIDLGLSFRQFLFYYFTNFCCSLPSRSVWGGDFHGPKGSDPIHSGTASGGPEQAQNDPSSSWFWCWTLNAGTIWLLVMTSYYFVFQSWFYDRADIYCFRSKRQRRGPRPTPAKRALYAHLGPLWDYIRICLQFTYALM